MKTLKQVVGKLKKYPKNLGRIIELCNEKSFISIFIFFIEPERYAGRNAYVGSTTSLDDECKAGRNLNLSVVAFAFFLTVIHNFTSIRNKQE